VFENAYIFGMRFRQTIRTTQDKRNLPTFEPGTNYTQDLNSTTVKKKNLHVMQVTV